jgi:hypothetical protein
VLRTAGKNWDSLDAEASWDISNMALFHRTGALHGELGYFLTSSFENLGGVGIFAIDATAGCIGYRLALYLNPLALPATRIAASFSRLFGDGAPLQSAP